MKKINVLKICYWCLLSISCLMAALVFPKWSSKNFIIIIMIILCAKGAGFVDRMIYEEKEK